MYQLVQSKGLSWCGEVDNSLILQHYPSHEGSVDLIHGIGWATIILFNCVRQDLNSRPLTHTKLHVPTNLTKLKMTKRWTIHLYSNSSNLFHLYSNTSNLFHGGVQWRMVIPLCLQKHWCSSVVLSQTISSLTKFLQ